MKNSLCLIGNSSVGIRECSYLGIPVVNIGGRQAGRERSENIIDVNYDKSNIKKAIQDQIAHGHYDSNAIYGTGNAGTQIAKLLASETLNYSKILQY